MASVFVAGNASSDQYVQIRLNNQMTWAQVKPYTGHETIYGPVVATEKGTYFCCWRDCEFSIRPFTKDASLREHQQRVHNFIFPDQLRNTFNGKFRPAKYRQCRRCGKFCEIKSEDAKKGMKSHGTPAYPCPPKPEDTQKWKAMPSGTDVTLEEMSRKVRQRYADILAWQELSVDKKSWKGRRYERHSSESGESAQQDGQTQQPDGSHAVDQNQAPNSLMGHSNYGYNMHDLQQNFGWSPQAGHAMPHQYGFDGTQAYHPSFNFATWSAPSSSQTWSDSGMLSAANSYMLPPSGVSSSSQSSWGSASQPNGFPGVQAPWSGPSTMPSLAMPTNSQMGYAASGVQIRDPSNLQQQQTSRAQYPLQGFASMLAPAHIAYDPLAHPNVLSSIGNGTMLSNSQTVYDDGGSGFEGNQMFSSGNTSGMHPQHGMLPTAQRHNRIPLTSEFQYEPHQPSPPSMDNSPMQPDAQLAQIGGQFPDEVSSTALSEEDPGAFFPPLDAPMEDWPGYDELMGSEAHEFNELDIPTQSTPSMAPAAQAQNFAPATEESANEFIAASEHGWAQIQDDFLSGLETNGDEINWDQFWN